MNNMRTLGPYLARHKVRILIGFLAIAGGTGFSVLQPFILRLAIDTLDLDMPVRVLSGGNKTKLSLARLLLSGAGILLDEEVISASSGKKIHRIVARKDSSVA